MAGDHPSADAVEQIGEIRRAFERAENAGDASVVDEHCADDVVAMPPGGSPTVGKAASKQALEDLFDAVNVDVDYTSEEVVVGEDFAFDRLRVSETHVPKDGGEPVDYSGDSLWVYRREPDGEWKQIRAMWNWRE